MVYLIGIGGIGMSSLARYFHLLGKVVYGYDRTPSTVTTSLIEMGIDINFQDSIESIPDLFLETSARKEILVIYTPAIPTDSIQLNFFKKGQFFLLKRSQVLGQLSKEFKTLAVAGSHGKTTVCAMIAEVLRLSKSGGSAFLGGISKNINSNLLFQPHSEWAVMEADEFDRSFLYLFPSSVLVTSMDEDHLDVYGDKDQLGKCFEEFINLLPENGKAIIKNGLTNIIPDRSDLEIRYYGLEGGRDYYAVNIKQNGLCYKFDLMSPSGLLENFETGVPGWINIENAVGAAALCLEAGFAIDAIRAGISNFKGITRRFDVRVKTDKLVYIDDYAHHPNEIKSFLESVRKLFPGKRITAVFQPHLFSRTLDFADEFGRELSRADELFLLDIYPAREKPVKGVSSKLILDKVVLDKKRLISKDELIKNLAVKEIEVLVTMGAGDIDRLVAPIEKYIGQYVT